MGWFTSDIKTVDDLFLHSLQDIYYAEHQIEKALPDMVGKASDAELKKGFSAHLKQTKGQIKRLDQAFKKLKQKPKGIKCPAIDGILDEANEIAGEIDDKMVLNARGGASGRALRDHPLRHARRLGEATRPCRCRPVADREPQRGKGHRQEAQRYRQAQNQQKGAGAYEAAAGPRRAHRERGPGRGFRNPGNLEPKAVRNDAGLAAAAATRQA
jgi:hypothetical protein